MSHNYTGLPEERGKRVGNEGGRLGEVHLKIPVIEGWHLCLPVRFRAGLSPSHHFHFRPSIVHVQRWLGLTRYYKTQMIFNDVGNVLNTPFPESS